MRVLLQAAARGERLAAFGTGVRPGPHVRRLNIPIAPFISCLSRFSTLSRMPSIGNANEKKVPLSRLHTYTKHTTTSWYLVAG